jgi:hypothetical protein
MQKRAKTLSIFTPRNLISSDHQLRPRPELTPRLFRKQSAPVASCTGVWRLCTTREFPPWARLPRAEALRGFCGSGVKIHLRDCKRRRGGISSPAPRGSAGRPEFSLVRRSQPAMRPREGVSTTFVSGGPIACRRRVAKPLMQSVKSSIERSWSRVRMTRISGL